MGHQSTSIVNFLQALVKASWPSHARRVPGWSRSPSAAAVWAAWSFEGIHMDVISSRLVASGRESLPPFPEIQLRDTSLWDVGFGGLNRRFKKGFYKDVRLTDPWSGRALRFPTSLHADNWLLRAFDPGCCAYTVAGASLQILNKGEFIVVKAVAGGQFVTGQRFLDLVVKKETERTRAAWNTLVLVAQAHGITPLKRGVDEIWGNLTLLQNLETMRSHLVMHVTCLSEAVAITPHVVAILAGSASMPVGELARVVQERRPEVPRRTIDFALFRGYRRGELHLDVESIPFGDTSTVTPVGGA